MREVYHFTFTQYWGTISTILLEIFDAKVNDLRLGFYAAEWNGLSRDIKFGLSGGGDHVKLW